MKPATPRKSRRRNQPNSVAANNVPASDYESDAYGGAPAQQSQISAAFLDPQFAEGPRTIGDMNLDVLKRHLPSIQSYICMSHNTTVYEWDQENDTWGEAAFKGPLFVCNQDPGFHAQTGQVVSRACIFLVNRLSLENLVLDMANITVCQQNDDVKQLIELSAIAPSGASVNWGLFIDQESLDGTWEAIQSRWSLVRDEGQ